MFPFRENMLLWNLRVAVAVLPLMRGGLYVVFPSALAIEVYLVCLPIDGIRLSAH